MNKLLGIGIVVALVAAGLIYWLTVGHKPAPQQSEQSLPAAATAPQPAITGTYADDWQSRCGPLTGDAQIGCTAQLDAAYGRKAEVPVPKY